ncbi:HD domain-containing protein [Alkalibacter saccharofermentans]|uniref:HD domain-containing protein n=1 Tax=Alkalibacter saccharofermentans DSM 14828 TaxID=1120975 RepID=A0A1M4TQR2_9FIRM|nr:HD domain-containing protein [Alkalibacter saccharofermentans]SHE46724.1 HD domain-containing protein [Alkalibacter saccharofermentans DSM 14828]
MIAETILRMIEYFNGDGKRINHALKVYSFASTIGEAETLEAEELKNLKLASILHDIGILESEKKYNSSSGKYQELEGPPIAKDLLDGFGLSDASLDRILYLIGNHHSYGKIDGLDFQILVEADFLVNIYEDIMDRGAIESIRKKIFKTTTGLKIFNSMYG